MIVEFLCADNSAGNERKGVRLRSIRSKCITHGTGSRFTSARTRTVFIYVLVLTLDDVICRRKIRPYQSAGVSLIKVVRTRESRWFLWLKKKKFSTVLDGTSWSSWMLSLGVVGSISYLLLLLRELWYSVRHNAGVRLLEPLYESIYFCVRAEMKSQYQRFYTR